MYHSSDRDLMLHGIIRPTVLTQEPSHLGKFFGLLLLCYYLSSESKNSFLIFFILTIICLHVSRSPSILFSVPLVIFHSLFIGRNRRFRYGGVFAIVGVMFLYSTITIWIAYIPFERAQAISAGLDASAILRITGPLLISTDIAINNPVFGAGIGGTSHFHGLLVDIYSQFSVIKIERFNLDESAGWGSAFFQGLAFNGLIGSMVVLFIMRRIFYCLGVHNLKFPFLVFFLVFSIDSAFVSPRVWAYFFIIIAINQLTEKKPITLFKYE